MLILEWLFFRKKEEALFNRMRTHCLSLLAIKHTNGKVFEYDFLLPSIRVMLKLAGSRTEAQRTSS